jgi:hypothetical protein
LFPIGRNEIVLRLENIGDKFDRPDETVHVKLYELTESFWRKVNGHAPLTAIEITETTLTTNQDFKEAKD